jgi:tetratricopeptide (TPR) repeat protein
LPRLQIPHFVRDDNLGITPGLLLSPNAKLFAVECQPMPIILNWLEFAYKHPAFLPVLILIGAGWILWIFGQLLWNRGRRGFRRFVLPFLAIGALIALPAALVADHYYLYRGLPTAFEASEVGILIAEVPGDRESEWQSKYARAIQEHVSRNPQVRDFVRVRLLERMLPADPEQQQAEALKIGRRLHASFVLRPLAIENVQEPWLTVVDEPHFSLSEARLGKEFPTTDLARLEELPLPSDVVLLARCMLAISLHHRRLYADASQQFREVLSAGELPPTAPERFDLEFLYADSLARNEQFAEAEAEDRMAIALKPQNADLHLHLGVLLAQQEKGDAAIAEFQRALALQPGLIAAYCNIGEVLAHTGRYDEAIEQYRIALAVKPTKEEDLEDATLRVRFELANSFEKIKKYDEAVAELEKVVVAKPKEASLHYNLGGLYFRRGASNAIANGGSPNESVGRDWNAAVEEYRRALLLAPQPILAAEIHINRGNVFIVLGRQDEAMSDFQAAMILDAGVDISGIEVAHDGLGNAYAMVGRYEEAIAEYRKALAIWPEDVGVRSTLAVALNHQGRYDEAIGEYQEVLKLHPNDTETKRKLSEALQSKATANQGHP